MCVVDRRYLTRWRCMPTSTRPTLHSQLEGTPALMAEHAYDAGRHQLLPYWRFRSVTARYRSALGQFRCAATHHHAESQHEVGVMHFNGRGVVRNKERAIEWWRRAAAQGYPPSIAALVRVGQGSEGFRPRKKPWASDDWGGASDEKGGVYGRGLSSEDWVGGRCEIDPSRLVL